MDFLVTKRPILDRDYAEQHLRRYTLEDNPGAYGIALDYEQPMMQVLALSFEELTAALLEGLPESITSQVPLRRS
ncbi:MAG: two-component response regulator-like APRR9 [Mycobacterium sp.]|nr:two-component response regulator-like APRR9 [Mycobacterium sp.]